MKYKLVEFIDGTWGILVQRHWWQHLGKKRFVDLTSPRITWDTHSEYFIDCKGNKEKAKSVLKRLTATVYRVASEEQAP